jgi:hypothetical protein
MVGINGVDYTTNTLTERLAFLAQGARIFYYRSDLPGARRYRFA